MSARRPHVLGASGLIGHKLCRALAPQSKVVAARCDGDAHPVDLGNPASIERPLKEILPALVVNAIACTAADRAQSNADTAFLVKCPAAAAPLNVYGHSYREGKVALLDGDADSAILPTRWGFAGCGQNFLRAVLHRVRARYRVNRRAADRADHHRRLSGRCPAVGLVAGGQRQISRDILPRLATTALRRGKAHVRPAVAMSVPRQDRRSRNTGPAGDRSASNRAAA